MIAAGVPPRKTMARTIARKLPEIFSLDLVSIAVRSLKTEKPSRMPKSAKFQFAVGARNTASAIAAAMPRDSRTWFAVVGRVFFMGSASAGSDIGTHRPCLDFPGRRRFPATGRQLAQSASCGIRRYTEDLHRSSDDRPPVHAGPAWT